MNAKGFKIEAGSEAFKELIMLIYRFILIWFLKLRKIQFFTHSSELGGPNSLNMDPK